jgi:hypothetical protein
VRRDAGGVDVGRGPLWASFVAYTNPLNAWGLLWASRVPLHPYFSTRLWETMRSYGEKDAHKGPLIHSSSTRVPTNGRVPCLGSGHSSSSLKRRDYNPLAAIQGPLSSEARISTIGPTHCAGNATCWLIWASPSFEKVTALVEITGPFAQTTLANT